MTDHTALKATRAKDQFADKNAAQDKSDGVNLTKAGDKTSAALKAERILNAEQQPAPKRKIVEDKADSSLGSLKISAGAGANENRNARKAASGHKQTKTSSGRPSYLDDEESVLMLNPANQGGMYKNMSALMQAIYVVCGLLTVGWLAFSLSYAISAGSEFSWAPHDMGAFLAGVFAPPALLWLLISSMRRRADVENYAASLRAELQSLLFPSKETAQHMNKDIENLCRQAAEVSSASKAVLKSLARARQGLRVEIRDFAGVSKKAEFHISRLAESLNDRASQLISVTDELEKRTVTIDEKAREGAGAWEKATIAILERAGEMESRLDRGAEKLLEAATRTEDKTKSVAEMMQASCDNMNETGSEIANRFQGIGCFVRRTK